MEQYVSKHLNEAPGGRHIDHFHSAAVLYILGKERQIYIYSLQGVSVKLVICFYLKSKRCLQMY